MNRTTWLRRGLLLAAALLWVAAPAAFANDGDDLARAVQCTTVLDAMMHAPDRELPADMLRNAYAVAVLPSVIKAGLVVAGRHGEGLVSVKRNGHWSDPLFVRLTGGSFGVQAGVSSTDILLIFRSERGVASIVDGKFILGTDLAVAAGPMGRNAQASTDAQLKAEIYAYSRSRGLFAGFSLQGSRLRLDDDANRAAYGKFAADAILAGKADHVPAALAGFRDRLVQYTAH